MGRTSKKHLEVVLMQGQALELRKAGATLQNIADALGLKHRQHAHKLISAAVKELNDLSITNAEDLRRMQEERLDSMRLALWKQRGNPRATDTLLRIEERHAKLWGLDAPTKIAPTTPDGEALPPTLDLSRLSSEQLDQLEAIYAIAGASPLPMR